VGVPLEVPIVKEGGDANSLSSHSSEKMANATVCPAENVRFAVVAVAFCFRNVYGIVRIVV
jgi:hypothetical protein